MSLKLIYDEGYIHTSKIGDLEINFKSWTAKEEREYLNAIEKFQGDLTDKQIYDLLIKPVIEKDIKLSNAQQRKLIIDIRKVSISDKIKDTIVCKECEKKTDIEINIDDIMIYKPSSYEPFIVNGIGFTLGDITNLREKAKMKIEDGMINYIYKDFILHIQSIEKDGEIYKNLKFKEIEAFMESLPTKIFDEVFNKYQEQVDSLTLDYEFICECGHKEIIDYTFIPNFLWV